MYTFISRNPTENLFFNQDGIRKFTLDLKHLHQRHHPLHLHPLDQLKYIQQQQLYYTCRPINNRVHKNPQENNAHQQQQIMHLNDLLCSLLLSDKVNKRSDTIKSSQRDDNADHSNNKPSNIDAAMFNNKNVPLPCKIVNNNNNSSYSVKKDNNSNNQKNNKNSYYYYYYSGSNQKVNNKNNDARKNKRNRKYNNNNNNIAFSNGNSHVNSNNNVKSSNLDDKSNAKNAQKVQSNNNNYNKKNNNNRNKKTYNNHYYKNNSYRTTVS